MNLPPIMAAGLFLALALSSTAFAQNANPAYSELVRKNASTFHMNFSSGEFEKNGALVNEKIYVNSNEAIVLGRDNFVARIKRFHTPFPTLKLRDRIVIVDDNQVGLLYIMQGTQDGPYGPIAPSGNKINVYAAEFFSMDDQAKMKELLTITQLDRLVAQIKGEEKIENFEPVTLLPIKKTTAKYKKMLKNKLESYVQNFNTRDWSALEAMLADNVQVNWNNKTSEGKQAVIDGLNSNLKILPDLSFHLEHNIVEGDRGALAYTLIGTYTDETNTGSGGKPVSKKIEAKEGVHFQFDARGKIVQLVVISNSNEINDQLK